MYGAGTEFFGCRQWLVSVIQTWYFPCFTISDVAWRRVRVLLWRQNKRLFWEQITVLERRITTITQPGQYATHHWVALRYGEVIREKKFEKIVFVCVDEIDALLQQPFKQRKRPGSVTPGFAVSRLFKEYALEVSWASMCIEANGSDLIGDIFHLFHFVRETTQ